MDTLLFILSLSLKIFTLYFAAVAVFALRRRRKYPRTAPRTRFAVVVAARNEEAVIGNLVHSVLSQDYPAALRDIYGGIGLHTYFVSAAEPDGVAAWHLRGAQQLHRLHRGGGGRRRGPDPPLHKAGVQQGRRPPRGL